VSDLPAGRYRIELWHPRLPPDEASPQTVEVGDGVVELTWEIALEPPPERPSRGFDQGDGDDDRGGFKQY
jgi:hypothetical protein